MDAQEEQEASCIQVRINAVMHDVKGVEKEGFNKHSNYKYAGHEAVTEAIRGSFVKHGIVQSVNMTEMTLLDGGHITAAVEVTWACHDNARSYIRGKMFALQHCQTNNGKPTAQQVGQALSYAVKNFAFKTLMLTGDTDGDSDASVSPAALEPPPEALAFLSRLEMVDSLEDVAKIGDEIQKWGKSGETPGLRDRMTKAFVEARRRIARSQ